MEYDYVDIGTADWDTSLDVCTEFDKVLLVEPIAGMLFKLPSGDNITKACYAIGSTARTANIYYVEDCNIQPVKGCNMLDKVHPIIVNLLEAQEISKHDIVEEPVSVITFDMLCNMYNITSIGSLKIDTEGHELIILTQVLNRILRSGLNVYRIQFELNSLSDKPKIMRLLESFKKAGYTFQGQWDDDVVLVRY